MAQLSSSNPNSLPGIVTDQDELYEYDPKKENLSDDTGINVFDLNGDEPANEEICTSDIPIEVAADIFRKREHEIFAKFFVQNQGEYKLTPSKVEEESDYEKYNRLVIEVNELLNKFHTDKLARSELETESGNLSSKNITHNLNVLAKQLKALELAAEDGSINPTQAGFLVTKSKLDSFKDDLMNDKDDVKPAGKGIGCVMSETAQLIKMGALEKRLNMLERVLGHNEEKEQNLLRTTNCASLTDVADTLSSWLSLFKPDTVQKINRELDYLTQRLEKINSDTQNSDEESKKLDPHTKARLDQLCKLVISTDDHRAKVPTIVHRLNSMEELQKKSAQVVTSVNYLEQAQAQIVDNLQWNKDELKRLNEMFATNLSHIKEVSSDIDARIAAIRADDDQ